MTEADKAVKRLNDSGIPATRSSDPDYLVFEIGESVFRALLPADPTHAASRLIEAVRNRGKILDGYRKTVAGLGRVEALEADDVYWVDILPRMNAGDSRISRFGFLFATTRQEGRGR